MNIETVQHFIVYTIQIIADTRYQRLGKITKTDVTDQNPESANGTGNLVYIKLGGSQ